MTVVIAHDLTPQAAAVLQAACDKLARLLDEAERGRSYSLLTLTLETRAGLVRPRFQAGKVDTEEGGQ